jgi:hypothetical protein
MAGETCLDAARTRLAEALSKAPKAPYPRLHNLALVLGGEANMGSSCSWVQEQLPAYVDSELVGGAGAGHWHPVREHLLACPLCGELYAELLESAWLVQRGDITTAPDVPPPDLRFLEGDV